MTAPFLCMRICLSVSKQVEGNDLSQARSAEPKEKCKKETRIPETTLSRIYILILLYIFIFVVRQLWSWRDRCKRFFLLSYGELQ